MNLYKKVYLDMRGKQIKKYKIEGKTVRKHQIPGAYLELVEEPMFADSFRTIEENVRY